MVCEHSEAFCRCTEGLSNRCKRCDWTGPDEAIVFLPDGADVCPDCKAENMIVGIDAEGNVLP